MWTEQKRLRVQDLSWDRGPACPVTQEKMGRQGRGQGIHLADSLGAWNAGLDELHGECGYPGDCSTWFWRQRLSQEQHPDQRILRTVACKKSV